MAATKQGHLIRPFVEWSAYVCASMPLVMTVLLARVRQAHDSLALNAVSTAPAKQHENPPKEVFALAVLQPSRD